MRVLIGCETSGAVRDAFRARGHDAISVDLLPTKAPGPHHEGDIFEFLDRDDAFDLAVLHPTCTLLTVAAAWCLYHPGDKALPFAERRPHPKWPNRRAEQLEQVAFVRRLWDRVAHIPRVAVENPVGVLSTMWRPISQSIQPYDFGEDASKRTCLWLRGLPLLQPTQRVPGRIVNGTERWANQTDNGFNRLTPSEDRWAVRSITYPGIAAAMADQWGEPDAALPLLQRMTA